MNEFFSVSDVNYLPRALTLYASLARTCPSFRLRVLCLDRETELMLERMRLRGITTVSLAAVEEADPEFASVRTSRTLAEYSWTAKPVICLYALEREPELDAITYLDGDLMFFHEPQPLFEELGDASVLVVPHRAPPTGKGTYNAGFLTFRRDERSLAVLRWWRERCLESCFARIEDGMFTDQRYLDVWPDVFTSVHVLEHPGGGLAPWNAGRYQIERRNGSVIVAGRPLIFYHYQSSRLSDLLRLVRRFPWLAGVYHKLPPAALLRCSVDPWYRLSRTERDLLWTPYLRAVGAAMRDLLRQDTELMADSDSEAARRLALAVSRQLMPRGLRGRLRSIRRAVQRDHGPHEGDAPA